MIVLAVGYAGTGSSAIVHLLSEYDGFSKGIKGTYEHILFYIPDGLFDLEDRLLLNNSFRMSDGAIKRFYEAMKRLNENDFGWFGGYKRRFGNEFWNNVEEFVSSLIDYEIEGYWSDDIALAMSPQSLLKDVTRGILKKKIIEFGKRPVVRGDGIVKYAFPSKEKFYTSAARFVTNYFNMLLSDDSTDLVLDQVVLPQNLYRINRYFPDVKAIVVDRDPRDLFVLSKYVWPKISNSPYIFPTEANTFCHFFKDLRRASINDDNDRVLNIRFEDLVYNYDDTVAKVERFLDIEPIRHTRIKETFNPAVSIHNTQNFRMDSDWEAETKIIEEALLDELYEFPEVIIPNIQDTSDPN